MGDARPFKCFLDTGLVRTSTGARVFATMKGASDGGLDIPHNEKRFAGYDLQDKSHDPDTLERYIKGGVVAEYAADARGRTGKVRGALFQVLSCGPRPDGI